QTGVLKQYNFRSVKRTRKTIGGGIYAEAASVNDDGEDDDNDDNSGESSEDGDSLWGVDKGGLKEALPTNSENFTAMEGFWIQRYTRMPWRRDYKTGSGHEMKLCLFNSRRSLFTTTTDDGEAVASARISSGADLRRVENTSKEESVQGDDRTRQRDIPCRAI
ncbi:hypothetical protein THAOC_01296, partial [Thalassiosira oceanica]